MFEEIEKIYYFMKRDALTFSSYRTNMLLMILGSIFGALSYAYLGTHATMDAVLGTYKMSFLTYLITGIAFSVYIGQSLTLVQKAINPWWLEEVLVTPTQLSTFILGSSAWGFVLSTFTLLTYLGIGILVFGITYNVNFFGTILVLALGIGTFVGFSMLSAGIMIVTKQGDPVTWLIGILTTLFGNVLFPPQVMPPYLSAISYVLPQYYFFTSIRLMMTGWSIGDIFPYVCILTSMCVVMLSWGYFVFVLCLQKVRKDGTLSWF